jgi:hypothetical protein
MSDPKTGSAVPFVESGCPMNAELGVPILKSFANRSVGTFSRLGLLSNGTIFVFGGVFVMTTPSRLSVRFFSNAFRMLIV